MKRILALSTLFLSLNLLAQKPINVEIKGNVFHTIADSVKLSQFYGTHYVDYKAAKLDKKGNFTMKATLPAKDYYVLRIGNQHVNIILRDSSKLGIYSDANNVSAYTNITGSEESVAMNEFIQQMQVYNQKKDSATLYLQQFPDQAEAINQSFQNEYFQFNAYKQQFIAKNPNSPALLPVLNTIDTEKEFSVYESIVNQLNTGFSGSPNIEATKQQFAQLKQKKEASEFLGSGKPAPDFTQNDVNGKPLSLSDLKGKVVLIDFWASWCGPCRKENPNVVALYNKYKDAGFTVMSVSLDDNKASWLAAIEKDKLVWPNHVSDLKKWSNAAARIYQVSGIPFTVLVDKEGNIIDTKLRGVELERALATIFGF